MPSLPSLPSLPSRPAHDAARFAVARGRWYLARHRWIGRALVLALALLAGSGVLYAARRAEQSERAWGEPVRVLVATEPIAPGEGLAGRVDHRQHPRPLVPAAAVLTIEAGAVSRQHIGVGEVLVASDVAAAGPAGLIPPGWRALAITAAPQERPAVAPGDQVGLIAGTAALTDGVVIEVAAGHVVVAVPEGHAAEAAGAARTGDASIVLADR